MNASWKPVAWLVLCCHLGGCSGYRALTLRETDPAAGDTEPLRPGDDVRLTLIDGRRIEGEFTGYAGQDLLVASTRRDAGEAGGLAEVPVSAAVDTTAYRRGEISRVEVVKTNVAGVLLAVAAVAGLAWALFYSMDHAMDDFGTLDLSSP